MEEQLESSQDSPEAGNFTNSIDLTKLPLVKDKKCTGQSEIVVQVLSIVSGDTAAATKQFTPSTFFCLQQMKMTILCCAEATHKGLNLYTKNAALSC